MTLDWNDLSTVVVITPTERLAIETGYVLVLDPEAQALSGGSLSAGLNWHFKTVPLPSIIVTRPAANSQQDYYTSEFYIKFASPMRIDTVKERIEITPKPEKEVEWWYNDWDWALSGFFLKPSTQYQIRFLPGMEDIYGNKIQAEKVIRFTTAAVQPYASLALPYDVPFFRASGPESSQVFFTNFTNVKTVQLKLASLTLEQMISFLSGEANAYQYSPPDESVVWELEEKSSGGLNERVLKDYPLEDQKGDRLPAGFYFLGLDSPEVSHPDTPFTDYRMIAVTSGNLTFKSSATQALVWLTELETSKPMPGRQIAIYDRNNQPIAVGELASDGTLELQLPEPNDPYDPRFAVAETADGQLMAFASTQWGSGVSLYDYGIWSNYYSPAKQPTCYIYSERPIYRPGQPVYFKGILRLDDDLQYILPDTDHVRVKISSFKDTVFDELIELTAFGSFDGKLTLDPEASLGNYTIEVSYPDTEKIVGSLNFNVAEYRKPEFQVFVTAAPKNVLAGQSFTAALQADYFSGGGLSTAAVNWTLTSEPFTFTPPEEFSSYSFQEIEEDVFKNDQNEVNGSKQVAQGSGQTDSTGRFNVTIPADLSAEKTSRLLTFEASVTDLAESVVSGRADLVAHLSGIYPGIKPQAYIGEEGKPQRFDIVALDWDGNPLSDQKLDVTIVERRWYSVQEQDPTGRVTWTTSVEEIPIESMTGIVTNADGKAGASFVPPNGGIFKAKVVALDPRGNVGAASTFLWVAGKDYIPWQQTNDRSFDLATDKKTYSPGETAHVLIASPFKGVSNALVTVERGQVRFQEVIEITSNSTIYTLPITSELAPNAYISVVIMKGVDEYNPRPNFKMGIKEIQVDTSKQKLNLEVIPDSKLVGPGEKIGFTVRSTDSSGEPVRSEVSLGLSDLATLSLFPPNSEPILDFFYTERGLGVWTSIPLSLNVDDYNADIEENIPSGGFQGSGGGKGAGDLGVVEVRQNFPDTAFWDAFVVTNEDGEARVEVLLPDNLTTWRMDARAVTEETRVGQTTVDIVSSKPLLVRPQTPRFFIAGDKAKIGAAVHNNTDQPLSVEISLEAAGVNILDPSSSTVEIGAHKQAYQSWDVEVMPEAERVDLIFSVEGGGYSDASNPIQGSLNEQGIPVYHYEAPETVGTSGQLGVAGTKVEAVFLPQAVQTSTGNLTIEVSTSLAAGMTAGLEYLKQFPYDCIEQSISRFLPQVVAYEALEAYGVKNDEIKADLSASISMSLQRLYKWQNPDGGWGWWSGEKSDALTTAYVILGMIEANESGFTVDQSVIEQAVSYLSTQVLTIRGLMDPAVLNRQAFVLFVLARADHPDVSSTVQLYDQRQRIALYARAFLTQTLSIINPDDPRLDTLFSDFSSSAIVSATGTHWEEEAPDQSNWNTDTRTTAIILSTLSLLDPENPQNANAVRWLMASRTKGHWEGTQETAWSLMALTNWITATGELEADYRYAVALNGTRLGGGIATPENPQQNTQLVVDISDLLPDEINRLAFARDGGKGTMYYTAHLNAALPVEEIEPLARGVAVSRAYYRLDNLEDPVDSAILGELLLARVTIVNPNALHYLVVDDPLPAGLEAVDQTLITSPQSVEVPPESSKDDISTRGWGWWYFTNIQRRDEKVVLSASYLPAGTYIYTYLVRASTIGQYKVIPTSAQEFYFPEVYGRGAGSEFVVEP